MLKHEEAPEEWSKILAEIFHKMCRKGGISAPTMHAKTDEAISEGWAKTLHAASAPTFDRNHKRADAFLLTAVINVYKSVIFSNRQWQEQEWDWVRNSAISEYARQASAGKEITKRVRNGGCRSLRTPLSLNQRLPHDETSDELGDRALPMFDKDEERRRYREVCAEVDEIFKDAKEILDEREYKIFMLRYRENMTYKEIASKLGTIGTERVRQLIRGEDGMVALLAKLGLPVPDKEYRGTVPLSKHERKTEARWREREAAAAKSRNDQDKD
jgi:RNA polymerase sigma factor (sigma-70 family)